MLPDSPPAAIPAPDIPTSTPPGLMDLFVAFAKMSLAGFGGVLVWARRAIVDQHLWMTADEFNETFALCHFPVPALAFATRLSPLWMLLAGGCLGFAGVI
jgi:chromate transporter